MKTTRTITHDSNHTDIETYLQDADGVWMWAVTQCNGGLAMKFLGTRVIGNDIDSQYVIADVVSDGAILPHSVNVDEYITNLLGQIKTLKAEVSNLNAGAKLMHSLATGGESRLDADLAAMLQWEDEKPITGINWQNYPDFEDEPKEAQPKIDFNSVPEIKL